MKRILFLLLTPTLLLADNINVTANSLKGVWQCEAHYPDDLLPTTTIEQYDFNSVTSKYRSVGHIEVTLKNKKEKNHSISVMYIRKAEGEWEIKDNAINDKMYYSEGKYASKEMQNKASYSEISRYFFDKMLGVINHNTADVTMLQIKKFEDDILNTVINYPNGEIIENNCKRVTGNEIYPELNNWK